MQDEAHINKDAMRARASRRRTVEGPARSGARLPDLGLSFALFESQHLLFAIRRPPQGLQYDISEVFVIRHRHVMLMLMHAHAPHLDAGAGVDQP